MKLKDFRQKGPNLVGGIHTEEPSLEYIIYDYYKSHDFTNKEAKNLTEKYIKGCIEEN